MQDAVLPKLELPPQPDGYHHRFHAMVKPIGATCNLRCSYCYYLHKTQLFGEKTGQQISTTILRQHIRQYIEAQTGDEVVFSWQGGEPTLAGLDFFREVVRLQAEYKKPGQRIENDLQTNGTLLNEDWVRFLKEHNFLVGLSIDGPASLHDLHRVDASKGHTHAKVVTAAKLLHRFQVPFSCLCVVNRDNSRAPLDVYRFLTRELGSRRLQFIACVEPQSFCKTAPQYWPEDDMPVVGSPQAQPGEKGSTVTEWSVDPLQWGRFLCKVWDDWYARDFGKVHVDLFENAIAQSLGWPAQRCITAEFCGKGLALESNGDVFSCDHYVYPEYRLGNILHQHWSTLAYCSTQRQFGFAKREKLPGCCNSCPHLQLCWGECPKNRFIKSAEGEPGLNYLCPGQKMFFTHIHDDMAEILRRLRQLHGWS